MNGLVVSPRRLLQMGAWMGLAYGLLEGLGFSVLRLLPWVMSPVNGTSAYILWIAPIYYAAIFVVVAGGFAALARCFRRVAWDVALVFVLVALAGFLACSFPGRFVMNYASLIVGLGLSVQVSLRQYRKHRATWSRAMVRTLPPLAIAVLIIAVGTIGMQQLREAVALARLPVVAGGAAPNVLLLVMDTQRADHLSSYGYHRPTSPRLDQLATEGVLFEHAHANSSWTVPSHASLMTGRFVWEHRAGDPWHPFLDGRHATLADVLQRAGYATGGFVANTLWAGRHTGLHRGFIRYEDYFSNLADVLFKPVLGRKVGWELLPRFGTGDIPGRKRAHAVNEDLLAWLDDLDGRPFFAFLNYLDVHGPYIVPPPYAGMFSGNPSARFETKEIELLPETKIGARPSPEKLRYMLDRYDECLRFLDAQIGALLDRLAQRGLLENTLVIVTADHGESFGEHGQDNHGHSLYYEQTHVPLILRYPKRLPAGVRVSRPVSTNRIPATVSALLGLGERPFPGRSLVPELEASDSHVGESILTELWRSRPHSHWPASRGWLKALVTDRWHYIVGQDGQVELYDLRVDRQEVHNLASEAMFEETGAELRAVLEHILQARPAQHPRE